MYVYVRLTENANLVTLAQSEGKGLYTMYGWILPRHYVVIIWAGADTPRDKTT